MSSTHTSDALSTIDPSLLKGLKGDIIIIDPTPVQAPPINKPPSSSNLESEASNSTTILIPSPLSNSTRRRFTRYW